MATLYTLLYGRSKKRMHPIMVDVWHKCANYMDARTNSKVSGFHKIVPSDDSASTWRQKSATIGGNRCVTVKRVGKDGKTFGDAGYIDKRGFNPHT